MVQLRYAKDYLNHEFELESVSYSGHIKKKMAEKMVLPNLLYILFFINERQSSKTMESYSNSAIWSNENEINGKLTVWGCTFDLK